MLSVGINAAPLAAPRTGVGRYILGLLGGLEELRAGGEPFRHRALFAPSAALASSPASARRASPSIAQGLFSAARAAAKRLPAAYPLAQCVRAALLEIERSRGLRVYHETNHAAPPTRMRVVLTVHDLSTLRMPASQEPARARFFSRALRARAARAGRVITPTCAIAREVVETLGVEQRRVRAIHHGLDDGLLEAAGARPPDRLRAAGVAGRYLLYVGALEPRKGLPVLLDAYDSLPPPLGREFPLVLGGPPERIDAALRTRLETKRSGRVALLGYVSPGELSGLYRGAAAFCLPSLYEGFGLPLLEAMACGTPSVASDDPALVEVAAGAALHFPRGDAPALAKALQRALDDSALRDDLSRRGLLRARAFSWEASARAHLAAYRDASAE